MIYIDFETRSKCDLKKSGAWAYAQHPSTEVLCMAWAVDDGPINLWRPEDRQPIWNSPTNGYLDQGAVHIGKYGVRMDAHNAAFESAIWKNIMTPKYGWGGTIEWSCSAAKCAAHSLPRALDKAGAALNLDIQKNQEGKRIMMKLCKPRRLTKNNSLEWHEDPEDYQKLYEYCMDDVRAERAISKALKSLNPLEETIWNLDQKINKRGIRVDVEAVKSAINISTEYIEKLNDQLSKLTCGEVNKITQNIKLLKFINTHGYSMESLTQESVSHSLSDPLIDKNTKKILEIRQKAGKTSVAKYKSIVKAVCQDERLRDLLMYHGSHTGRWAGKIFQPHNLPVNRFIGDIETYFNILKQVNLDTFELLYPDVMETISYLIRPLLIPSKNTTFFGGDYSSIEARVLLWLAGDKRALKLFEDGEDIYKDLASEIFNIEPKNISDDSKERQLGKQGILGLGYQMGGGRFQDTCKSYSINIDIDTAEKIKTIYRRKYYKVRNLWYDQEAAAIKAVNTKKFVHCGQVGWYVEKDFLFCKLPSKRLLAFYKPRIADTIPPWGGVKKTLNYMHVNPLTRKWEETTTYGGKIVENITQAIARDLLAYVMLICEDAGYRIVLHIHDEIISEREKGMKEEFCELMKLKPSWAREIPIDVKPWSGKRYLK